MKAASRRERLPAELSRVNFGAAGVDVGAGSHFVAVPESRCPQPVHEYASFTADLYRLADWLAECGVETVAMESTGVYWIPLFGVLEERGFQVMLVDPRRIKNVPGRTSRRAALVPRDQLRRNCPHRGGTQTSAGPARRRVKRRREGRGNFATPNLLERRLKMHRSATNLVSSF